MRQVPGSSPGVPMDDDVLKGVKRLDCNSRIAGSNPVIV